MSLKCDSVGDEREAVMGTLGSSLIGATFRIASMILTVLAVRPCPRVAIREYIPSVVIFVDPLRLRRNEQQLGIRSSYGVNTMPT